MKVNYKDWIIKAFLYVYLWIEPHAVLFLSGIIPNL